MSSFFYDPNYKLLVLLAVILVLFNNIELVTTDKELKAMAKPANSGLNVNPIA